MTVSQSASEIRYLEPTLTFAHHEAYLAGIGHRTAALEDSRLLPLVELPLNQ